MAEKRCYRVYIAQYDTTSKDIAYGGGNSMPIVPDLFFTTTDPEKPSSDTLINHYNITTEMVIASINDYVEKNKDPITKPITNPSQLKEFEIRAFLLDDEDCPDDAPELDSVNDDPATDLPGEEESDGTLDDLPPAPAQPLDPTDNPDNNCYKASFTILNKDGTKNIYEIYSNSNPLPSRPSTVQEALALLQACNQVNAAAQINPEAVEGIKTFNGGNFWTVVEDLTLCNDNPPDPDKPQPQAPGPKDPNNFIKLEYNACIMCDGEKQEPKASIVFPLYHEIPTDFSDDAFTLLYRYLNPQGPQANNIYNTKINPNVTNFRFQGNSLVAPAAGIVKVDNIPTSITVSYSLSKPISIISKLTYRDIALFKHLVLDCCNPQSILDVSITGTPIIIKESFEIPLEIPDFNIIYNISESNTLPEIKTVTDNAGQLIQVYIFGGIMDIVYNAVLPEGINNIGSLYNKHIEDILKAKDFEKGIFKAMFSKDIVQQAFDKVLDFLETQRSSLPKDNKIQDCYLYYKNTLDTDGLKNPEAWNNVDTNQLIEDFKQSVEGKKLPKPGFSLDKPKIKLQ